MLTPAARLASAGVFLFTTMNENKSTENAAPETVQVTAGEIVAPLGERMPPVTVSAPSGEETTSEPRNETPSTPAPDYRDSRNMKFDAFRHQANADGTPRKNAKGNFMLKNEYRRGILRRDGSENGNTQSPRTNNGTPSFAEPSANGNGNLPAPDQYELAAEVYLQAAIGPMVMVLGGDIRPDNDEHAMLKTAIGNYLRATGATELSPGWALTITIAAFAAKKASVPTIQERALGFWDKVKSAFGRKAKIVTPV